MNRSGRTLGETLFQPMNPGVRLFRTWLFQLSILVPATLSAIFFVWISHVENLGFEVSSEGVRNLWTHHRLSITLLGLTFPLTALVASHHRSVQASEQIRQQQSQNLLTNHFAHTEEFVKVWEELELPTQRHLRMSMREIHNRLFPQSLKGNFEISEDLSSFLSYHINEYVCLMDSMHDKQNRPDVDEALFGLHQAFLEQTGISLATSTSEHQAKPFHRVSITVRSLIATTHKLIEAASFLPPYNIRSLRADLEHIEDHREHSCGKQECHELRLAALCSSIDSLLEAIHADNPGNRANVKHLSRLFSELVRSGDYSEAEIQPLFPFKKAQVRGMYLPNDIIGWAMTHAPR